MAVFRLLAAVAGIELRFWLDRSDGRAGIGFRAENAGFDLAADFPSSISIPDDLITEGQASFLLRRLSGKLDRIFSINVVSG